MEPKISAASTALFSTWVFLEDYGLLLDAGDGVSAALGQKGRKVKDIFLTHADRDHVCGLLQLHQLNAREGIPRIYYPADCGSFPALRDFVGQFDPQSGPATWKGLQPGDLVELDNGLFVEARASEHVEVEGLSKALDFTICRRKQKLKAEHQGLPGPEIARLRKELGDEALMEEQVERLIGYSGDAPKLDPKRWAEVPYLLHEATFLEPGTSRNAHSSLGEVIEGASALSLEALVLLHFSARYSEEEIRAAITSHAERVGLSFPVYAVLPGETVRDLLDGDSVWKP